MVLRCKYILIWGLEFVQICGSTSIYAGSVAALHKKRCHCPVYTISPMSTTLLPPPLTVSTVQGALKDARGHVKTLERRLEEVEDSRGQVDFLKIQLQELEVSTGAWLAFVSVGGMLTSFKHCFNWILSIITPPPPLWAAILC